MKASRCSLVPFRSPPRGTVDPEESAKHTVRGVPQGLGSLAEFFPDFSVNADGFHSGSHIVILSLGVASHSISTFLLLSVLETRAIPYG